MAAKPPLRARVAHRLRRRLAPHVRLLFEEAGLAPTAAAASDAGAADGAAPAAAPTPAPVESPLAAQVIHLEYPVNPIPRWGYENPPHRLLDERIGRQMSDYADWLEQFLAFSDQFGQIPVEDTGRAEQPCWRNGMFPGLDIVALYGFLALTRPRRYLEIGSGQSTRVASLAIHQHGLDTTITSIDPQPRADIDALCDRVIRQPLEETDLSAFDQLDAGDILFIDGTHRTLMNSDVTVALLDVLPTLRPGVLVQIHDIRLPWDYPHGWIDRYYSEQYVLAAYLLATEPPFDIVLPNFYVSIHEKLARILEPLWCRPELTGVETHGESFWLRTR